MASAGARSRRWRRRSCAGVPWGVRFLSPHFRISGFPSLTDYPSVAVFSCAAPAAQAPQSKARLIMSNASPLARAALAASYTAFPLLVFGCGDGPIEPEDPAVLLGAYGPSAGLTVEENDALHEFLPATTLARESGPVQVVELPIAGLDFSRYMEPFVLRVRVGGDASAPPRGQIWLDGEELLAPKDFARAGAFDLEIPLQPSSSLTVKLMGAPGTQVTVSVDAAVQPPPTLVITSPARASMLNVGTLGVSPVQVTGEACHVAFPITTLVVNGDEIPVSGTALCESFSVTQSSRWGASVITAYAANARGREANAVQSYLRSPDYLPVAYAPSEAARIPAGMTAQMNDGVFPILAVAVSEHLESLDLGSLVPDVLYLNGGERVTYTCFDDSFVEYHVESRTTGFAVVKNGTATATPLVYGLRPFSDGLQVTVRLADVYYPATITGYLGDIGCPSGGWTSFGVSGSLSADWVEGTGTYQVGPGLRLTASEGTVDWRGINLSGDLGVFDFMSSVVDLALFDGLLRDTFREAISDKLPFLFEWAADFAEDLLWSLDVDRSAVVNGRNLRVVSALESADFGGLPDCGPPSHFCNGFGAVSLSSQVMPQDAPAGPTTPFGAVRAGGAPPAFSAVGYDYGVGLSDDLLNQTFWSAWQAGAFEIPDLEAFTGVAVDGISGGVSALLPPVAMPGTEGAMLDIGWGDVRITALVDPARFGLPGAPPGGPVAVEAFASAVLGGDLGYDESTDRFSISGLTADVQVQLRTDAPLLDEVALAGALESAVEAALLRLAPEAVAALPPPSLSLSTAPSLYPRGASLERQGRYIVLTGSVGN